MNVKKRLKEIPRSVKASAAIFFANVVTKGIAYLTTPIYTRLLTANEYGQVSIFLTWESIFGIIAMFCLSYGVFNNGMLDYPEQRDQYTFSMLVLSNLITIIFTSGLLVIFPFIKVWIGLDYPLLLLMVAVFLFQPAYDFWVARQRYELRYKATAICSITCAICSSLIAVLCILFSNGNHLYARLFGAYGILILIYVGFYIYIIIKARRKLDVRYWKSAILFNLPLIPHYISGYLLNSADKLMISSLVSDSATAYYSVAYSVAAVVTTVWSSANASLIPFTYESCKEKKYSSISSITSMLLTGFGAICFLLILLAPEVVAAMATQDYLEAIYVIPPIVGGVFFQAQYYIYANIIYYYKCPKYVMYASVFAALLNIVLNYIFINHYGYLAAGYTTLVCYLFQAAFDYFAMKNVIKETVYNMKYIGSLSACILLISLVGNFLYKTVIVRYGILFVIVTLCILNRRLIIKQFITFGNMTKATKQEER